MMRCRENMKDQLNKDCLRKGWCTNMIDLYIKYTREGLRLENREKYRVKEEGYREVEGQRESQGQIVMR